MPTDAPAASSLSPRVARKREGQPRAETHFAPLGAAMKTLTKSGSSTACVGA